MFITVDHVCDVSGGRLFPFFSFFFQLVYSDFKRPMALIEQKTRDSGRWSNVQTVDNAVAMYEV